MLALRKSMFAMPAAALEGHVIVDYGLQLGHARSYNQKKSPWPDLCPQCTTYARWRKMKADKV
jgi:hypothetical protein